MRNIEIEDEVLGYLQSKAIPFVETPNLTLRRLFNLNGKPTRMEAISQDLLSHYHRQSRWLD
jgi:negative regulator of replication initiation